MDVQELIEKIQEEYEPDTEVADIISDLVEGLDHSIRRRIEPQCIIRARDYHTYGLQDEAVEIVKELNRQVTSKTCSDGWYESLIELAGGAEEIAMVYGAET